MDNKGNDPEFIVLNFADSKIPVFKESRHREYVLYGEKNNYPEYLTHLFNKSAKHNAILNGKAFYIFGKGFENGDFKVNRLGETLNDISKKAILDIEIYGGFRFEIIWDRGKRVREIYHVDYSTLRIGKDGGFWYKESWDPKCRDEEEFIPAFDPSNPIGTQIYSFNEYRPMVRYYPLPSYIGCNNYIETDIEISKYYLSAIRNGMMPSKMVQFYQGEPTEDKKRDIEKRFANKFAGSENAGKFLLVFNSGKDKQVDISDLSATELDKQFQELNKTCQQEIFSGHNVTSPMLFGIKTEGQLGGNNELDTSYSIFQNTYSKPKAEAFGKEITYLLGYSVNNVEYVLQPTDPIGWIIPDSLMAQAITPDEVRLKLGLEVVEKPADSAATKTLNAISSVSPLVATKILDNLTKNEIRGLAALPPIADGDYIPTADGLPPAPVAAPTLDADTTPANDNIRNLTAKQHQQVMRIIRQYSQGKLTQLAAKALLRTGYGLDESDINDLLGISVPVQMSAEEDIIIVFDEYGESKNDFEILKSKKVCFSQVEEAEEDEAVYIEEAFKTYDITRTEERIIELIKKDSKITPKIISEAIGETEAFVKNKIASLTKKGFIESSISKVGTDEVIERIIPKGSDIIAPPSKQSPTKIFIKYSYEGPQDSRNRPFCAKLMQLNRLYSRADIERISERLGYSVFDRRGGFWNDHGDIKPHCRHSWKSNIVIKKGGESV